MSDRPSLKKLRTGALSRGLSLAKLTLGAGARAAGKVLTPGKNEASDQAYWVAQAQAIARELGQLKGSAMKVGQLLSMYGEHFFPPEVNEALKHLQSQSPPLAWPEIRKVLARQLPPEKLELLRIEQDSWASASLGQVHRARVVDRQDLGPLSGRELALKIQYPGVDAAIDSDLQLIRGLFSAGKLIPGGNRYEPLFLEIRDMLQQEVDYGRELEFTREYAQKLAGDPRYVVPQTYGEFSTKKVLATEFVQGVRVDDPQVRKLPLERRNRLAQAMLALYLREIFEFGMVQTDPHFGNYLIRLGDGGEVADQIVLLDFGAVRKLEPRFLKPYRKMIRGAFMSDAAMVSEATDELGFTGAQDSEAIRLAFANLCQLMLEPFAEQPQPYRWQETDLPKRAMRAGMELSLQFRFRPPPREIVFLDRKLGGVFIWVAALGAEFNARPLLEAALRN